VVGSRFVSTPSFEEDVVIFLLSFLSLSASHACVSASRVHPCNDFSLFPKLHKRYAKREKARPRGGENSEPNDHRATRRRRRRRMLLRKLCVFCGSSSGNDPVYVASAETLGKTLAKSSIQLTYGGGSIGLMGAVAKAAWNDGQNRVLGIIPEGLCAREISGETVGDQIKTKDMHERKRLMAENSDGFVALPGGFGTMEELFEVITWQQLGYHKKPIGVLNVNGYFDSLLKFLDEAKESGFVSEEARNIVLADDDAERLIEKMRVYTAPRGVIEQEFQG
jgi:uncharacterized protein (TIGR00730 family)